MIVIVILFAVFFLYLIYAVRRSLLTVSKEILITDIRKALWNDLSLSESDREFLNDMVDKLQTANVSDLNISKVEQLIYR
jgi:hypothetical protein